MDGILKLIAGAFKLSPGDRKYALHARLLPHVIDQWRVLDKNGQIAAGVHIGRKSLGIGQAEILLGDVGEVSVLPSHQGEGLGTAVLTEALDWMKANRYDLSRLGGLVTFYSRFGYRRFPRRYIEFTVGKNVSAGASTVKEGKIPIDEKLEAGIKPYDRDRHGRAVADLLDDFYKDCQARLVHANPSGPPALGISAVLEDRGEVIGYISAQQRERELTEFEAGVGIGDVVFPRDRPEVFEAMIAHVHNHALHVGVGRITARMPFDGDIIEILARMPIRCQIIETYGGLAANMLQIVNLESLFERLLPELEARLAWSAAAEWEGVIDIAIEKDAVQLHFRDGQISISSEPVADVRLAVKEFHLMQLVLGLISFAEIKNTMIEKNKAEPMVLSLLNDLFPRKTVYSGNWG